MYLFYSVLILLLIAYLIGGDAIGASEITSSQEKCSNASSFIEPLPARSIPSNNMEAYMSAVEIIISRGYHAEMHPVTTDDDYILMLHRIPYPKGRKSGPTGSPVFIPHGLAESSADWLLLPSDKSLAFVLADLGYDVWLGNFRGNTYSRGHVTFDSNHDRLYWKYSFDEIGRYDVPAMMNHILASTDRKKLIYIGFSLGSTAVFTCMHYHPELNDKIELMVAIAPVATVAHTKSTLIRLSIPYIPVIQVFLWMFVGTSFLTQEGIYTRIVNRYCPKNHRFVILCRNLLFVLEGFDYGNMDANRIKVVNNHVPAGASIQLVAHYAQNAALNWDRSPRFNQFNHGWIGNLKYYGQMNPPPYNLSRVTVPVHIFHGAKDNLASPKGVEWTASKLPNVKQVFLVKDPTFNHLDAIFRLDAKELLYDHVIAVLPPP